MDQDNTNDMNADDQTDGAATSIPDENKDGEGLASDQMPELDVPEDNLIGSAPPDHEPPDNA
ncbi:hypothetical protein KW782_03955 [Candidatus Parcubacteria bacterium]|nr:hypothetical protein [Candidatus Parcubacteria bacterium]